MSTSLTAILHQDVMKAPSGLDAYTIAKLLPRNYNTLMSELGRAYGHKLGADLVPDIMKLTGSDNGIHYLARELGGEFIRIPKKWDRHPPSELQLVKTIKEFSEFIQSVTTAYLDGKITAAEFAAARQEAYKSIAATLTLLDLMESDVEGEE